MAEKQDTLVREMLEGLDVVDSPEDISGLPEVLEGVDRSQRIAIAELNGPLNLNAIAIGLGLENIEYEPEQFPGLVYHPPNDGPTVLLFDSGTTISPYDSSGDPTAAIEQARDRLLDLGLYDGDPDEPDVRTEQIEDVTH